MKKILFYTFFIAVALQIYGQGETDIWVFGNNAGLDFNSGSPVPYSGSQLNTVEGCSSIADENGALLFYTDGIKVWNKNHQLMPNGNGLGGNPSSSQSGLIVPNPNDPTIYYLFTVGTNAVGQTNLPQNSGFKYYTVNMTLNGGLGDVLPGFVNLSGNLSSVWTEKVTAVKTDDCDSFWAISLVQNKFYSYLVDANGVASSPVISTVSNNTAADVRGYLKVAPDGTKIVAANMNAGTFIYDFNDATGTVSNGLSLNIDGERGYGVEFSLDSKKLYIATGNYLVNSQENLFQFNMESSNLNSSRFLIHSYVNTRGALQLASNGKIYWASDGLNDGNTFLSVINNPEAVGAAVNYSHRSVSLGGNRSTQGLPPFIQSSFLPNTDIINTNPIDITTTLDLCDGDTFRLQSNDVATYPATTTYEWFFNENLIMPAITTSFFDIDTTTLGSGEYKVIIDFNDASCVFYGIADVTFHANPTINSPITINQCDDDTDGISVLDLTIGNSAISTDPNVTFTFFTSPTNAEANLAAISTPSNYTTGTNTFWVRVDNENNCHSVAQLNVTVTASATAYNNTIYKCDDFVDATNNEYDGIAEFNLTQFETAILNLFPVTIQPDLNITYYKNINDALLQNNTIINPTTYRNSTINNERIFVRINNNSNLDCAGLGIDLYIDLVVESVPILTQPNRLQACEISNGQAVFDTSGVINEMLNGQTNVALSFFDENNNLIPTTTFIPSYTSVSQTIKIVATNTLSNDVSGACEQGIALELLVNETPIANPIAVQQLCDDEPDTHDGVSVFDTTQIEPTILAGQTNAVIHYFTNYYNATLKAEILPTLPVNFASGTQTITAEVRNADNPQCFSIIDIEFLIEEDTPIFEVSDQLLCLDQLPSNPLQVIVENPLDIYQYVWTNSLGEIVSLLDNAMITEGGEYTVTGTSVAMCETVKTFFVTESSIPTIETVTIFDDSANNRFSVLVSGAGDYEFALDDGDFEDGNELYGHVFYNVPEGLHTFHINDKNGCTPVVSQEVIIIRFPKFITPNFDGVNDTFSVYGGDAFASSNIVIFNRYGKVIKVLKDNASWNGFYLDKVATETDYWFLAEFIDNQGKHYKRKGHFSLKIK